MKNNIILLILMSLSIISCNDWLDVTPSDTIEETDLFTTGEGYRIALNGVYSNISSESMYAHEMTWGFLDVLAQYYDKWEFDRKGYYYKYAYKFYYDNDPVRETLENIWQKAYKSIANCNNLIQNIANEDASSFAGGELEKNMIEGEAIALRAFLHFDLLRLFAPSPAGDDGNRYIPYCNTYPSILQPGETVDACLEKTINDLVKAQKLVGSFDTIPEHKNWLQTDIRIEAKNGTNSAKMPNDLFYAFRGFRMNYYAIKAILARVYAYAGELEKAYDEALEVCLATNGNGDNLFEFTSDRSTAKLYDGVIFSLNNKKLVEKFETYYTGGNKTLSIDIDDMFDGEQGDIRYGFIREEEGGVYISEKYLKSEESDFKTRVNDEMIPIIRLSELYYIIGEYLYSSGNTQAAIDKLKEVRIARNVVNELPEEVNNIDDYKRELLRDAKRDFIGEGQLFYMYKRFDIAPSSYMRNKAAFVMPIPDSESINL